MGADTLAVATPGEPDVAGGECAAERVQRPGPGSRHPERVRVDGGQRGRRREQMGDGAERPRHRVSVLTHQPGGRGGGTGQRDLLAEHGAKRKLVTVGRAGYAPARGGADGGAQQRIIAQRVEHGGRIGVQAEHRRTASCRLTGIAVVGEVELDDDRLRSDHQLGDGGAAGQPQTAPVERRLQLLDADDGPPAEVAQQGRGVERRRDGETEAHRA